MLRKAARRALSIARKPPASVHAVEAHEWRFYLEYLSRGMTVFDVGANVGELSIFFSRFVGEEGTVHCFEPGAAAFKQLESLVRATGRSNYRLNPLALADIAGTTSLYTYGDWHSWSSQRERPLHRYGIEAPVATREDVPSTTLDSYSGRHGIESIDLLKIDVEGSELQVLRGGRQLFARRAVKCCIFEFGQTTFDMGNDPGDLRDFFDQNGYALRSVVPGDPIFPGSNSAEEARFAMTVATVAK